MNAAPVASPLHVDTLRGHPVVTLVAVHAALSYFYDHQAAIRAEWDGARALIEALRDQGRQTP